MYILIIMIMMCTRETQNNGNYHLCHDTHCSLVTLGSNDIRNKLQVFVFTILHMACWYMYKPICNLNKPAPSLPLILDVTGVCRSLRRRM
jgi:hypothetical protein